ncbi:MAG TPA: hypothetical protein QKA08_00415 [Candidatus Megaira endosymbiont of Nemacystus decipiens]|nr:hypothetical protein [Candidatus Megaera endosymbiont of Nemacystus decipiens]
MDDKNELTLQKKLYDNLSNEFMSCAAKGDLEKIKQIELELTNNSSKIPAIVYGSLITDAAKNGHSHIVKYSLEKIGIDSYPFQSKMDLIAKSINSFHVDVYKVVFGTIDNQSPEYKVIVNELLIKSFLHLEMVLENSMFPFCNSWKDIENERIPDVIKIINHTISSCSHIFTQKDGVSKSESIREEIISSLDAIILGENTMLLENSLVLQERIKKIINFVFEEDRENAICLAQDIKSSNKIFDESEKLVGENEEVNDSQ